MQQCQALKALASYTNDNCIPGVITNKQKRKQCCLYCEFWLDDGPDSLDDHLKLAHGFRGTMWTIHCLENDTESLERCSLLLESLVALLDHAAVAHGGKVRFEFATLSCNRRLYAAGEISFVIEAGEVFDDDVVDEVQKILEFGRVSKSKSGMDWLQVLRLIEKIYGDPNRSRKRKDHPAR